MWFGELDSFWTPLIIADQHNISLNLSPVTLTSPKKLLPQTLPAANWLWPFVLLKRHISNQETHKAAGTTLSTGNPVRGADITLITGEQWRANRSQLSHQVTQRCDEEEWNVLSLSSDCLLDHMQTWCTWTPTPCGTYLPEIGASKETYFTLFMDISWCSALAFHSRCQLEQV